MLIGMFYPIKYLLYIIPKKIKIDDIHKKISLLGHSTEKYEAPEEIYNSLPECCRYKTNQPH